MKNHQQRISFILLAAVIVFLSCTNNDVRSRTANATDSLVTGDVRRTMEEDFIADVLDMTTREIAWLKAGMNKGTDSELKSQAKKMLADHETLRKELKDYAQKSEFMLADTDTSGIVDLAEKPGIEWDEEWADEVADDHKFLVKRFERAGRRVKDDTALINIITRTLPVLQSHYDASRKLENRLERNNEPQIIK